MATYYPDQSSKYAYPSPGQGNIAFPSPYTGPGIIDAGGTPGPNPTYPEWGIPNEPDPGSPGSPAPAGPADAAGNLNAFCDAAFNGGRTSASIDAKAAAYIGPRPGGGDLAIYLTCTAGTPATIAGIQHMMRLVSGYDGANRININKIDFVAMGGSPTGCVCRMDLT